ncbi:hypothetical protein [Sphingobacterium paludis]|uniref:Uncharacterized protein n=1 Tax=Sphingobacterium paludis TaxID=1476465 RepID=A0A4R7D1J9_9SPHI|nr:hypothetical protein [Sphingobacterium paludis]TDS14849.1 hypothetical protein B0I21_103349 [Sphingobacterium paludis]
MRKFLNLFWKGEQNKTLNNCDEFKMNDQHASNLFGGYREAKPPIHELKDTTLDLMRVNDLLSDIGIKK